MLEKNSKKQGTGLSKKYGIHRPKIVGLATKAESLDVRRIQ
jgi:hypothetical protein